MDGYLSKPVDKDELRAILDRLAGPRAPGVPAAPRAGALAGT